MTLISKDKACKTNIITEYLNENEGDDGINIGVSKKYVDEQDNALGVRIDGVYTKTESDGKFPVKGDLDTATKFTAINPTLDTPAPEVLDKVLGDLNQKIGSGGGELPDLTAYALTTDVDTKDALLQTGIDTNTTNIDAIINAPLTPDADVLGTEEILSRKPDGTITTINQAVLAGSGGGELPDMTAYAKLEDLDTATKFKAKNPTLDTPVPEVLDKVLGDLNQKIGSPNMTGYAKLKDLDTATKFTAKNPTLDTPAPEVLDKVLGDLNQKIGINPNQKRVMVTAYDDPNTMIDKNNIYLDEIVIKGTSGANGIKILCAQMTKEEFEGAVGVGAFGKTVKVTLEDTIIKSVEKLEGSSSIATHSLVNAFNVTAPVGEVRISCLIDMIPQASNFATCFRSQYEVWRIKFHVNIPLDTPFIWNAQLVFEGEYLEIEWRDWYNTGTFSPRIKKPLWYEGVFFTSGSALIYTKNDDIQYFDRFVNGLSRGIYGTCYEGRYSNVTNAIVTRCLDLGDILAEGHPLKYRLAMFIPHQLVPTCVDTTDSTTSKSHFRNDALSIQAKVGGVMKPISPNVYANEGALMFDNVSGTYMLIPMGNKTFKGYSYNKCARGDNDNIVEIGEHNSVLKHTHNFTGDEAPRVANTGTNLLELGTYQTAMYPIKPYYKPTGKIGIPTDASISDENRVDSLYVYKYLRF